MYARHAEVTDLTGDDWAFNYHLASAWQQVLEALSCGTRDGLQSWRLVYFAESPQSTADLSHPIGIKTLMAFAAAFNKLDNHSVIQLDVVSSRAFSVDQTSINYQHGAIHGFLSSLNQEAPDLICRQIAVSYTHLTLPTTPYV